MIASFYSLNALSQELQHQLSGKALGQIFSQSKSELVIPFVGEDGETATHLRTSIGSPRYCFEDPKFSRAKRNVAEVFGDAKGQTVSSVLIADRDRCLFIHLQHGYKIALALTGASSNAYLVDPNNIIVEAFSDNAELAGTSFSHTRPAPPFPEFDEWMKRIRSRLAEGKPLVAALSSSYPFFDRQVASEIIARLMTERGEIDTQNMEALNALYLLAAEMDRQLIEDPQPVVVTTSDGDMQLALYVPTDDKEVEAVGTVNVGIRKVLVHSWREGNLISKVKPARDAIEKKFSELKRAVEKLEQGLTRPSRAEQYKQWADLLMAWQGDIPAQGEFVEVPDFVTPDSLVKIPILPGKNRTTIAQHYYEKSRKAKRRREEDTKRLSETRSEMLLAEQVMEAVSKIDTLSRWHEFEVAHGEFLGKVLPGRKTSDNELPFRSYLLPGDYRVYVGKNATQNDNLTTRFAKKDDYWLHARGVPGSHVVLQVKGREDPPTPVLEAAASIAAYHSKSRGSSLAPVIVVKKKHVRKPKGAQKGTVVVEKENVLLVEPRIPKQS